MMPASFMLRHLSIRKLEQAFGVLAALNGVLAAKIQEVRQRAMILWWLADSHCESTFMRKTSRYITANAMSHSLLNFARTPDS